MASRRNFFLQLVQSKNGQAIIYNTYTNYYIRNLAWQINSNFYVYTKKYYVTN